MCWNWLIESVVDAGRRWVYPNTVAARDRAGQGLGHHDSGGTAQDRRRRRAHHAADSRSAVFTPPAVRYLLHHRQCVGVSVATIECGPDILIIGVGGSPPTKRRIATRKGNCMLIR